MPVSATPSAASAAGGAWRAIASGRQGCSEAEQLARRDRMRRETDRRRLHDARAAGDHRGIGGWDHGWARGNRAPRLVRRRHKPSWRVEPATVRGDCRRRGERQGIWQRQGPAGLPQPTDDGRLSGGAQRRAAAAVPCYHRPAEPARRSLDAGEVVARLQEAGDTALLRLDEEAGHGIGSTRSKRTAEQADFYASTLWQAGMPGWTLSVR